MKPTRRSGASELRQLRESLGVPEKQVITCLPFLTRRCPREVVRILKPAFTSFFSRVRRVLSIFGFLSRVQYLDQTATQLTPHLAVCCVSLRIASEHSIERSHQIPPAASSNIGVLTTQPVAEILGR